MDVCRADTDLHNGQEDLPSEKAGPGIWCLHRSEMDRAGWPNPYSRAIARSDYNGAWSPRDNG